MRKDARTRVTIHPSAEEEVWRIVHQMEAARDPQERRALARGVSPTDVHYCNDVVLGFAALPEDPRERLLLALYLQVMRERHPRVACYYEERHVPPHEAQPALDRHGAPREDVHPRARPSPSTSSRWRSPHHAT